MSARNLKITGFVLIILSLATVAVGQIVFEDNFEYTDAFSNHGWSGGTSDKFSIASGDGVNASKCVRIKYDEGGTGPYWFRLRKAAGLAEFTVEFAFKVQNTPAYGGCKFLKAFGVQDSEGNSANTTWMLEYNSGDLGKVHYGPGTGKANDCQATIGYDGRIGKSNPDVKVVKSTSKFVPQNNTWHIFRAYMKFNTNGQHDGEYRVWVDNVLRVHAINVKNRHDENTRALNTLDLANYSSKTDREAHGYPTWYLFYDNFILWKGLVTPGGSGSGAVIQTVSLPTPVMGVSYTHKLSAVGGATPYEWSISSGSLPTGMNLHTTLGLIYGTPASTGTYNFTVTVKDGDQNTNSRSFSWSVMASSAMVVHKNPLARSASSVVKVYDVRGALLHSTRPAAGGLRGNRPMGVYFQVIGNGLGAAKGEHANGIAGIGGYN